MIGIFTEFEWLAFLLTFVISCIKKKKIKPLTIKKKKERENIITFNHFNILNYFKIPHI